MTTRTIIYRQYRHNAVELNDILIIYEGEL